MQLVERSLDYCAPVVAAAKDATVGDPAIVTSGPPRAHATVLIQLVSGLDHH